MENCFNPAKLVEVCGPTESILVRPGEFLFREDDEAQSLIGSRMIRLHTVTEGIALKMLARNGIAAIWQLQVAAGIAYRTGHPGPAASIIEIAEAAEREVLRRGNAPVSIERQY